MHFRAWRRVFPSFLFLFLSLYGIASLHMPGPSFFRGTLQSQILTFPNFIYPQESEKLKIKCLTLNHPLSFLNISGTSLNPLRETPTLYSFSPDTEDLILNLFFSAMVNSARFAFFMIHRYNNCASEIMGCRAH